jgi:hypothetical protein
LKVRAQPEPPNGGQVVEEGQNGTFREKPRISENA